MMEYLERWRLGNEVFGDGAEMLGIIADPRGVRCVIRQPEVEAADLYHPHPTTREIYDWMWDAGFAYDSGAWVREADGVVVTDAHVGNFIKTKQGLRPVDVDVSRTGDAVARGISVIPWAENPANPDANRESTPPV
ncbi:MAG: hypothetical protein JNK37_15705 [Verrucomicrobiales bacterium]|nr:hypothetical protein [Verrucomicrobiales bacterium]